METESTRTNKKRTHSQGVESLPSNVRTSKCDVDKTIEILANVDPTDHAHMLMVIDYVCTTIAMKHQLVHVNVITPTDLKDPSVFDYQVFFGLPHDTKYKDTYSTYLKSLSFCKITEDIEWEYNKAQDLVILKVTINPSNNLPAFDDITVSTIHFKKHHTNIIYDNNNGSKHGSIKRNRLNET